MKPQLPRFILFLLIVSKLSKLLKLSGCYAAHCIFSPLIYRYALSSFHHQKKWNILDRSAHGKEGILKDIQYRMFQRYRYNTVCPTSKVYTQYLPKDIQYFQQYKICSKIYLYNTVYSKIKKMCSHLALSHQLIWIAATGVSLIIPAHHVQCISSYSFRNKQIINF